MSADLLVGQSPSLSAPPRTTDARVGLLGCGVVGTSVARVLLEARAVELRRVAVLRPEAPRDVALPPNVLCGDAFEVVEDPSIDVVVEAIGGVDLPRSLLLKALANGKSVVTANKELLSLHGRELALASEAAGADLLFEGAVCAALPVVSTLRERLAVETIHRVSGVVNGTTNLVLELMATEGLTQREALAEARRSGYAEADPAADLDGRDAAAKLAILAGLAFDGWVTVADVERAGIEGVGPADLREATARGYSVKLVAEATRERLCVRPALVPRESSLARVTGVENEVVIDCSVSGRLAFRGLGAGGDATAGAVAGDVVIAARNLSAGARSPLTTLAGKPPPRRTIVQGLEPGPALPIVEV